MRGTLIYFCTSAYLADFAALAAPGLAALRLGDLAALALAALAAPGLAAPLPLALVAIGAVRAAPLLVHLRQLGNRQALREALLRL